MSERGDARPERANEPDAGAAGDRQVTGRAEPGPPPPGTNQSGGEDVQPAADRSDEETSVGSAHPGVPGVLSSRGGPEVPDTTALAAPGRPDGEVDPRG